METIFRLEQHWLNSMTDARLAHLSLPQSFEDRLPLLWCARRPQGRQLRW